MGIITNNNGPSANCPLNETTSLPVVKQEDGSICKPSLLSGLRSASDATVAASLLLDLKELCSVHTNKSSIVSYGGIHCVLDTMHQHFDSAEVQEYGCVVLCNLAATGSDAIVMEGGISAVLAAMRFHSASVGVQEQACGALRSFLASSQDLVNLITVQAVDVQCILFAMKKYATNQGVQEQACGTLCTLAFMERNIKVVKTAKGVVDLLEASQRYFLNIKQIVQLASHTLDML